MITSDPAGEPVKLWHPADVDPFVQFEDDEGASVAALLAEHRAQQAATPATSPAARFFVALDGYDEPTLWEQVGDADPYPIAVHWQLTKVHPALWPVVVAAFTSTPDQVAAAVAAFQPRLPATGGQRGDPVSRRGPVDPDKVLGQHWPYDGPHSHHGPSTSDGA